MTTVMHLLESLIKLLNANHLHINTKIGRIK